MLVGAYGVDEQGKDDPEAFYEALEMEQRGYVPNDKMDEYNENPGSGAVDGAGYEDIWWSSTAASASSAHALVQYSGFFLPQHDNYKGYGLTVRAVKESA